ncbi:MAG: zf-HC2 domain-containing protein [Gemmatimonadota bacterium]
MNRYDCDRVQDLLPSLARGELLFHERESTQSHVNACDACRDELALVLLIQQALDPVPAALEARVLAAIDGAHAPAGRNSLLRWPPARLAMAAAVTMAVIGGSLLADRFGGLSPGGQATTDFDLAGVSVLDWSGNDPLLHPAPIEELTVEELEALLAELDS